LDSTDFEDAIRNAVSIGGDSDTLTCITGGIAQAFYGGVPDAIAQEVLARLDDPLRKVVDQFRDRYS
jgi:ADP-ribosylglycohydrolase